MSETLQYLIIGVIILSIIVSGSIMKKYKANKNLKRKLSLRWGGIPEDRYNSEELEAIAGYHRNLSGIKKDTHFIDNITWNDLDMDNIFKRINSTATSTGEEYLFNLLHEPVFIQSELDERERLMKFISENPKIRLELQFILAKLGKNRCAEISDYFLGDKAEKSHEGMKYLALCAGLIISPLLFIVNPAMGLCAVLGMFFLNITVHYKAKQMLAPYLDALSYIVNMVGCSKKLAALNIPEIRQYTGKLGKTAGSIHSLSMNSFYLLFYRTEDPLLEYIKTVFLGELIAFESLMKKIRKYKTELRALYETIGYIDSMIALASYRESLESYTIPVLSDSNAVSPAKNTNTRVHLDFKDIYHPLISKPVTNSLSLSKPALITGSNASGKSTFLKTAAINAIFAQTINTCLAGEYRSSFFMIFSSMALKDSLFNKESYYIAEIKSLKRIFDALSSKAPCLCLIDEVLRGTNTIERIAASSEVLYRLSRSNCICIAATHDLELSHILGHNFNNFHFQESIRENEIVFDYRLYPGKSTTRNAIRLLKFTGYDKTIADRAEERALSFIHEGKWEEIGDSPA